MKLLDQRLYHFEGTPKEIGLALGRTMGARLAQNIERYIETGPGRHSAIDRNKLHAGALPWLRSLPQRFQEEFAGIAAGADLPLQRLAEWAFVEKCVIEEGGCSAALVRHGDHVWVARNNDLYAPDMWGYVIVRDVAGRIPRLDFGLEGEIFSGTGVNRERLWLHYNWLPTRGLPRLDRPHLEGFVWLSEALETCRNLRDVEALLRRVDRDGGMMIFAVDGKTEEAAIYECTCSEYREARLEIGGTGWIAGTNHYRLFDFGDDDAPQGSDSSQRRYRRMQEMLAALMSRDRAPDFPDDLIAILADPAVEVRGADYGTVYAAVACPGAAQMWTTLGGYPAASAGRWRSLRWPWR